jgi:hypothetical protein
VACAPARTRWSSRFTPPTDRRPTADRQRLTERQGVLSEPTMRRIDEHLRIVLDLD